MPRSPERRTVPYEIMSQILDELHEQQDMATVVRLLCTSSWVYQLAAPRLYAKLVIREDTACAMFAGVGACVCPSLSEGDSQVDDDDIMEEYEHAWISSHPGRSKRRLLATTERIVVDGSIPLDLISPLLNSIKVEECCDDGEEPAWRVRSRPFPALRYVTITARGWMALDRWGADKAWLSSELDKIWESRRWPPRGPSRAPSIPYPRAPTQLSTDVWLSPNHPMLWVFVHSRPSQLCIHWPGSKELCEFLADRKNELESWGVDSTRFDASLVSWCKRRIFCIPTWLMHLNNVHWTSLMGLTLHNYRRGEGFETTRDVRDIAHNVATIRIDLPVERVDKFSRSPLPNPNDADDIPTIAWDAVGADELVTPMTKPRLNHWQDHQLRTIVVTNLGATLRLECKCRKALFKTLRAIKRVAIVAEEGVFENAYVAYPHWSEVLPCPCCGYRVPERDDPRDEPKDPDPPCDKEHPWCLHKFSLSTDSDYLDVEQPRTSYNAHLLHDTDEEWGRFDPTPNWLYGYGTEDIVEDYTKAEFRLLQRQYLAELEELWEVVE